MNFNLYVLIEWWPKILSAFGTTLFYFIVCSCAAVLFAILISMLLALRLKGLTCFLRAYIAVFRNTPLLVQLFLLFYGLPFIGIRMPAFFCGLIGVALNEGAFISEIIRGYIEALPRGDWEAGESLGLSRFSVIRYAILPQALRDAVPAVTGQISIIIKDTSLFSMIMISELTRTANSIYTRTFDTSGFIISAILYLLIFFLLTLLSKQIERRYKVKR
ncbi:amino acid ABC transporter permease [Sediminispirochaeta bajacaliforniensis]|uniref:amino acid ABC transporter permease n=1 Tax=Sediminispirochaeta bajacaliforniensis TaxID=148 RepID=UPI0003623E0A|nr:amino acid ABC transporter permease [Sediminispirochaeta bajacaliforniensis]